MTTVIDNNAYLSYVGSEIFYLNMRAYIAGTPLELKDGIVYISMMDFANVFGIYAKDVTLDKNNKTVHFLNSKEFQPYFSTKINFGSYLIKEVLDTNYFICITNCGIS